MAHIVYLSNGFRSYVNASIGLCRQLANAGHSITYLCPEDVGPTVEAQGFRFIRLIKDREIESGPSGSAEGKPESRGPFGRLGNAVRNASRRRASLRNDEIERTVAGLKPDVLLIDIEFHYAIIATSRLNIPTLLTTVWYAIFARPGIPPPNTSIIPGQTENWQKRIGDEWDRVRRESAELRAAATSIRSKLLDMLRPIRYKTKRIGDLKPLAKRHGFSLAEQTDSEQWLRPFVYVKLPILRLCPRELEFPYDPPANVHYVGATAAVNRVEAALPAAEEEILQSFLQARKDGARLVYCSLGTFWSADLEFLVRIIEVFRSRPDWRLVLGLGAKATAEDLGDLPRNVLALSWAPQFRILGFADAAITHGGVSSIAECLVLGVPMLVYSTGFIDQNGAAARVAYHRVGILGDKDADKPEQIEAKLEQTLSDEDIRRRISGMQRSLERYEKNRVAVSLIESIIAESRIGVSN